VPEPDVDAAKDVDVESDGQPDEEFLAASGLSK